MFVMFSVDENTTLMHVKSGLLLQKKLPIHQKYAYCQQKPVSGTELINKDKHIIHSNLVSMSSADEKYNQTIQTNCQNFLPLDLPTELQSSPIKYENREKCRDPWRPTEFESNSLCLVEKCHSDHTQENNAKRRTGASCQALKHAVYL
ncbi:hypothetical protein KQX54_008576 [Cotesia glomerata]|uniref:Uncharacterized protein n=1 Tax=Cotesia glomerata TaxID=32391 RepID=A0AAV7ITG8_COTGL|nr:hypothetical protein KQX54_008576 [Cotesia glomerata]